LRLAGIELPSLMGSGAASLALVLGGTEVRVVPIERSWQGVGTIIEVQVPFDRIGLAGSDVQFAIQVRNRADAVLESVPHGRHWTITVPQPGLVLADWQA
jgi:hypothetical protein